MRRAREEFRKLANETDVDKIEKALQRATEELKVLQRTSSIYKMYEPEHKSVLVSCYSYVREEL